MRAFILLPAGKAAGINAVMNERRIAELEELMSLPENYSDHEKLAIYNAEYEEVKSRLETLYKKWEELA